MSEWHEVTLAGRQAAGTNLTELELETRGTPVAASYIRPGQFVKVSLPDKGEAFFAIASAPGARGTALELLVKGGAPLADALVALPLGSTVRLTQAQGKGFPLEEARGRRVLLFATGSGISPLRSLIDTLRRDRAAYGDVTLYFGVRTPDAFAYVDELDGWIQDQVRVVRVVSRPGDSGWDGLQGYVQAHVPDEPLAEAVAFLCGVKGMVQGVTEVLVRQGLRKDRLFLNF